jgi:hypothetical protein
MVEISPNKFNWPFIKQTAGQHVGSGQLIEKPREMFSPPAWVGRYFLPFLPRPANLSGF